MTYLHDVVGITRLDAFENMRLKLCYNLGPLLVQKMVKRLLHDLLIVSKVANGNAKTHSASIHLHRELQDASVHLLRQRSLLELVTMFKHFLSNIVPKNVGHELVSVGVNLVKEFLTVFRSGDFELLLDKSRTMLVASKLDNMAEDVL